MDVLTLPLRNLILGDLSCHDALSLDWHHEPCDISFARVQDWIALTRSTALKPQTESVRQLLQLLTVLPTLKMQPFVLFQENQEVTAPDVLAFQVFSAISIIVRKDPDLAQVATDAFVSFWQHISEIEVDDDFWITLLFPLLNGLRRAVESKPILLGKQMRSLLTKSLLEPPESRKQHGVIYPNAMSSNDAFLWYTMDTYTSSSGSISRTFQQLVALRWISASFSAELFLSSTTELSDAWDKLQRQSIEILPEELHDNPTLMVHNALLHFLDNTNAQTSSDDDFMSQIYAEGLRALCLSSLLLPHTAQSTFYCLEKVLYSTASIFWERAVSLCVEGILVLARSFPSLREKGGVTALTFINTYTPNVDSEVSGMARLPLAKAADILLLSVPRREDLLGLIYGLANVADLCVDSNNSSLSLHANANAAFVMSCLANSARDSQVSALIVRSLFQSLEGLEDATSRKEILLSLVASVPYLADEDIFLDVVRHLAGCGLGVNDGDLRNDILTVQTKLAESVRTNESLAGVYLGELARLFVERSMTWLEMSDVNKPCEHIQEHMRAIVSVMDSLAEHLTSRGLPSSTRAHLIDFWLACSAAKIFSSPIHLDTWQLAAFRRLARCTPALLHSHSHDNLEQQLQLATSAPKLVVKMSMESSRTELTSMCPSLTPHIRHLTAIETLWMLSVIRVESCRVENLTLAACLDYLRVEGTMVYPLSTCLSIASQSFCLTFINHLQARMMSHTLQLPQVSQELRHLLCLSCDRHAGVRATACSFLDQIFDTFPHLLCIDEVCSALLDTLTLLEEASSALLDDPYTPHYSFESVSNMISIQALDTYVSRKELENQIHVIAKKWLSKATETCKLDLNLAMQTYVSHLPYGVASSLGVVVALEYAGGNAIKGIRSQPEPLRTLGPTFGNVVERKPSQNGLVAIINGEPIEDESSLCRYLIERAQVLANCVPDPEQVRELVVLPFAHLTSAVMDLSISIWTQIAHTTPAVEGRLVSQILLAWSRSCRRQGGLTACVVDTNPLTKEAQFTPMDTGSFARDAAWFENQVKPHLLLLSFLDSRACTSSCTSAPFVTECNRLIQRVCSYSASWTTHALFRELRFCTLSSFLSIARLARIAPSVTRATHKAIMHAALYWFASRPKWTFGSRNRRLQSDVRSLRTFRERLANIGAVNDLYLKLLRTLLDDEVIRLELWECPLLEERRDSQTRESYQLPLKNLVRTGWNFHPTLAAQISRRFKSSETLSEFSRLVEENRDSLWALTDGFSQLLSSRLGIMTGKRSQRLDPTFLSPVAPIDALRMLTFNDNPTAQQYALRTLEQHPVQLTFFYVPQVVQCLRHDALGYVERFIFETASISQLFCHQIIWNMKANTHKDDNAEIPDRMKSIYDRLVGMIVESLSGESRAFYEREFLFFDQVTSISRTLQPFIKRTKDEKKAKIDEEIAKIVVDPGVYLPSNPDGVVVDINRLSGRPLQSHAKAPFMATFKVKRQPSDSLSMAKYEWQGAIFKVGDDCRQDVLALQVISLFQNIFASLGLTLQLVPYRVTATGPGCGVIDVIPNATSRDEMGRAKINNLTSFFISKFGPLDSIPFQKARTNFVQSMAAYSVVCYIIQIKDRHNGNIMIDGTGRLTHIDFGFLFDIGPGGIKFEPNSFKLSHEMVVLMGGKDSDGFRAFSQLTVKAFLACRPFVEEVCTLVNLMMETELPSFKGQGTIHRLRERFRPDLGERAAAEHMEGIIRNAFENSRSVAYDQFQKIQNNIPYAY
ncbi:hypothetical protein BT69DRAFT_1288690 [Atractiella rhizophila]|nr:hypothetical protein BT69DRAFT_1288690 [Atractiella rhizophila]